MAKGLAWMVLICMRNSGCGDPQRFAGGCQPMYGAGPDRRSRRRAKALVRQSPRALLSARGRALWGAEAAAQQLDQAIAAGGAGEIGGQQVLLVAQADVGAGLEQDLG